MAVSELIARPLGMDASGSRVLRRRRFQIFLDLVDRCVAKKGSCRIIDIGGEAGYWDAVNDLVADRPIHVTMVNRKQVEIHDDRFQSAVGDARGLTSMASMSFDVVHSNSVIEHVGRWQDMLAMAEEVRRLAPAYFVQTPYFWFPIEPHASSLFFHWLPEPLRASMLMRRTRGHWQQAADVSAAVTTLQDASLLDGRMLAALFPDAVIHRERFCGFTKSLMAVRTPVTS